MIDKIKFLTSNFSLKKYGSIIVTKKGKVEKVINPIATVEICIDLKNENQCRVNIAPKIMKIINDFLFRNSNLFLLFKTPNKNILEKNTLPQTITNAGNIINLPNKPLIPNKKTEKCS